MNNYIKFIVFILILPLLVVYEIVVTVSYYFGVKLRVRDETKEDDLELAPKDIYNHLGLSRKNREVAQLIAIGPIAIPFLFLVAILEWLTCFTTFMSKVFFPERHKDSHQFANRCKSKQEVLDDDWNDLDLSLDDDLEDLDTLLDYELEDENTDKSG